SAPSNPRPHRYHTRLLYHLDSRGEERPVKPPVDWQRRREQILAGMQAVMGPLPGPKNKVPLDVRVAEEVRSDRFIRRKITFAVEKGDRVPGYLFLPPGVRGKVPAVLCLHQTVPIGKDEPAGLGGKPNLRYALELAERGYVT